MPDCRTILIVDDELNVLKSLKRLLLGNDYKLLTATSGKDGLDILKENKVQIVISDYRMPEMTGVEFLNIVKDKYPDTIRMILSGYADVSAVVEAINEGHVYKFIGKPWNDQEVITTIMRAFEQQQLSSYVDKLNIELQNRNQELELLTKSLEEKVAHRTRDLEMKNRALIVAQNILNRLPTGVMGIDSDMTVVYMNNSLGDFIDTSELNLGQSLDGAIDKYILKLITESITNQKIKGCRIDSESMIIMICTPLTNNAGMICTFYNGFTENHDCLAIDKALTERETIG
ncbi:MAG: response regulator [candidate division Zixibacteria bacterium]